MAFTIEPELPARGIIIAQLTSSIEDTGCRRLVSPEASRALEILGHAIEYLADEYAYKGKAISADDPQVTAIQILMALNRQIYFACPVKPTFAERLRKLLHFRVRTGDL